MTGYDTDDRVFDLGKGAINRIYRLCRRLDRLHSKHSESTSHQRCRNLKRVASSLRLRRRIRHLVDYLHFALAKWLCENYRVILTPKFDTQAMVSKKMKRKLRSNDHIVALQVQNSADKQSQRVQAL